MATKGIASAMPDRRQANEDVTPKSEDWGIFKNSTVSVRLALTPLRRETSRGDLLVAGYLDDSRVEVVFPGRRRDAAQALEEALDKFARKETTAAQSRGTSLPHATHLRFPLHAEGIWRTRIDEVEEDDLERIYQFMAARWTFHTENGEEKSFGEPPIPGSVKRAKAG